MKFEDSIYYADPEHNKMYLRLVGRYLNDLLNTQGYLYKNQIYESLGIEWDPLWENTLYVPSDGELEIKNFIE